MSDLFLTSSGLTERTAPLYWEKVGKVPRDTRAIMVPSAAVGSDSAREGISMCWERLVSMGIPEENILLYHLGYLLSAGYQRTYSAYVEQLPPPLRLLTAEELSQYDTIVFCGGNAQALLEEVNRTGFAQPLKEAVHRGLTYLGISAGSMIAAGNFPGNLGFLENPLFPHGGTRAAPGPLCGKAPVELADGQLVWVHGQRAEVLE